MREPHFWTVTDKRSRASAPVLKLLMTPLSMLYRRAGENRIAKTTPIDAGIPVICIGNLTLGGAGKTPVTAAVRAYLSRKGARVASLSRGYRGSLAGPTRVDALKNTAAEVGDEPLMLAATGEAWISKDRPAGAQAMKADGVQVAIMDDGHQNPTLKKSLSIVVIDATNPFGNGHIFPKGPLRERVADGLARADAVVLMGDGPVPDALADFKGVVLHAHLAPLASLPPGRYVAFAGIGRPERFFDSLQAQPGIELSEAMPFPDHHAFQPSDLSFLMKLSKERDAQLVTTDKDHVRLPADVKGRVMRASVEAKFEDEAAFHALLNRVLA
ncbi:MAG: tetraacyldisaccharide 4'-kinase [Burkholderiales bacterium]|nr:MAG: tetraacyldisaccharide 4'-kinase [Burkholderiales bacterium]